MKLDRVRLGRTSARETGEGSPPIRLINSLTSVALPIGVVNSLGLGGRAVE